MEKLYTNENLAKYMGLKVGDKIALGSLQLNVVKTENDIVLRDAYGTEFAIYSLLGQKFKILPKTKCYGDLVCGQFECRHCPIKCLDCSDYTGTLYECLESWFEDYKDEELFKIFKKRLDKEIK